MLTAVADCISQGYTYNEIVSTCTDKLIDRGEYIQSIGGGGGRQANDNAAAAVDFPDAQAGELEDDEEGGGGGSDDELLDEERRQVAMATRRSEESAAEEAQIREVLARSAEESGRDVFRFGERNNRGDAA